MNDLPEKVPQWFLDLYPQEKKELLLHFDVADEEKFCDAFMSNEDRLLRMRAVKKIKSQDRLWHYAVHDYDPGVRAEAAVRLTDNDRLLSIVENDTKRDVRTAAAATITDRGMLQELAWSHPDRWIRKAAILSLRDDEDLMMTVFSASEENELRIIAASRIQDQECLKHIIRSAERLSEMDHHNAIRGSADLRRAAVLNLDDHGALRDIASDYDEITIVRMAAASKLGEDDQDILEMIAAKPYDPDPRRDPDLYYDPGMKASAVARLTDEDLLRGYLDDGDMETRAEARIALRDPDILKDTVSDPQWQFNIRKRALRRITDQDFLYDFAMHHVCGGDREETQLAAGAAKMLFDPKRLSDIAMGAEDPDVSKAAAECLHDDDELLRVITEIEHHEEKWASYADGDLKHAQEQEIKITAAGNLEDLRPLVRLVLKDPGEHYEINNFKEYGIGLLSRRPDLMLRYVKRESDEWALSLAGNFSADESVLQAIADKGLKDTYASYKKGYLSRVGEIGLKRKDEKVQFWKDALITASDIGVRNIEEYADGDRVCLAKIMLLWLYHSAAYFAVHVSSAEIYDNWERCKEIAAGAIESAIGDVMSLGWPAEKRAELKRFEEECAEGAYDASEIALLVRSALSCIYYDEALLKEAEEKAAGCIDYVRFKTYSIEENRKEEVTAPYRTDSSEPPPGLDEFEYIDWVITH